MGIGMGVSFETMGGIGEGGTVPDIYPGYRAGGIAHPGYRSGEEGLCLGYDADRLT